MKKFITLLLLLNSIYAFSNELNAEMFSFDEDKIKSDLAELTELEELVVENPTMSMIDIQNLCTRFNTNEYLNLNAAYAFNSENGMSNMGYFWTTFAISAVGTFFIYSAVAGPIAVAVIYFTTDKDMEKTKSAAWGCAAGTLLGAGIKFAISGM